MNKELLIPTVVVIAAVAFLDPFMVLMPGMLVYMALGLLFVAFISYALLIFNETAYDEREEVHRAFAGRIAYITGVGVLVLGIMYQVLVLHTIDGILVIALAAMTIAKYVSVVYAKRNL